jgi:hypothetical protein
MWVLKHQVRKRSKAASKLAVSKDLSATDYGSSLAGYFLNPRPGNFLRPAVSNVVDPGSATLNLLLIQWNCLPKLNFYTPCDQYQARISARRPIWASSSDLPTQMRTFAAGESFPQLSDFNRPLKMQNCQREVQRLRESCATSSSVVSISSEVWKAAAAWTRREVCIATAGVSKYYVVYSIFCFL